MIYYFDSIYVIGGLALLFLILLAFLKFMKRKSNMYLLCFSVMYIYLCVVLDLTQFPIYASEGMKAAMGGQNVWREMNLIPLKTIVTDFFNGERSEYYSDNSIGIWVIVSDEMLLATNYAEWITGGWMCRGRAIIDCVMGWIYFQTCEYRRYSFEYYRSIGRIWGI